jgi:predicted nucleic acid-binding Zn ribbon protein
MPFYEYEIIQPDGAVGERFEVWQRMDEPALTQHPETGQPVRRIISAPTLLGKYSDHAASQTLKDDRKLSELGLTKYVKNSDGGYERRSGTGPDRITP